MIYYIIAVVSILILWYFQSYLKWKKNVYYYMEQIKGPVRYPIIGTTYAFIGVKRSDLFKRIKSLTDQYGPFFRTWNGSSPEIHIMKPQHLEQIMSSTTHLHKGGVYDFAEPWLGSGLLLNSGNKWHKHRKLITPTFHFKILANFMDVFVEKSNILVKSFEDKCNGEVFDVFPEITNCALDVICETAMGVQINAMSSTAHSYVNVISEASELIIRRAMQPWHHTSLYYLFPEGRRFKAILNVLHRFTNKVIADKKKMLNKTVVENSTLPTRKRLSFLDLLLDASKTNNWLTDNDIREEVDNFMFAGHDTTTVSTCWTIFLLANHPDIQEKVYQEVCQVLGDNATPRTLSDLNELKYLECCIKESLRLYPSVPVISRTISEDILIDGYKIPKGVFCKIHIHKLHRDAEIYPEPDRFDPDRFLPDNSINRHPYAYVPFSAGPRNCIGQKFAMYEEKTILASLLRSYRIKPVDTLETIHMVIAIILRPENGVKIMLEKR